VFSYIHAKANTAPVLVPIPVVPADPLNLSAVKDGVFSKLSWSFTRDANTKQFMIERSVDGVNFTTIGIEPVVGNIGALSNYTFYDLLPFLNKMNVYRVKEINKDGTFIYSKVVEVDFAGLALHLTPNPAHGSVTVGLDNAIIPILLQVLDINGRVLQQRILLGTDKTVVLNLSGMAAGVYTVRAVGIQGVVTQKLVVF
jgi:hypothetical protein